MISQSDNRILGLMIEKCERLIEICDNYSDAEIEKKLRL